MAQLQTYIQMKQKMALEVYFWAAFFFCLSQVKITALYSDFIWETGDSILVFLCLCLLFLLPYRIRGWFGCEGPQR